MRKGMTEDTAAIKAVFDKADVLWLALTDENGPHCVPVNFAEKDGVLYIHSGKKGRKAAALNAGTPLAFSCAVDIRMRPGGDDACDQGYFFRSVMGRGTPRIAEGDERMSGLDAITVKHLGKQLPYNDKFMPITVVYAIDVESVTARIKE